MKLEEMRLAIYRRFAEDGRAGSTTTLAVEPRIDPADDTRLTNRRVRVTSSWTTPARS